jgi:large subunit ribosomal protein L18
MNNSSRLKHRRRAEGKTNYKVRYALLKSLKTRLVIRRSSKNIIVQFVEYNEAGDKTLVLANSKQLVKLGWKSGLGNLPASYLTGLLAGIRAKGKVESVVLDLGSQVSIKGSRIYAALKGVIDAGVDVPYSEDVLPSEERISGKHIEDYTKKQIVSNFEEVKKKIMSE